jgi:hypothetical protein
MPLRAIAPTTSATTRPLPLRRRRVIGAAAATAARDRAEARAARGRLGHRAAQGDARCTVAQVSAALEKTMAGPAMRERLLRACDVSLWVRPTNTAARSTRRAPTAPICSARSA